MRTPHKDPVAHARMTEGLLPSAAYRNVGGEQKKYIKNLVRMNLS